MDTMQSRPQGCFSGTNMTLTGEYRKSFKISKFKYSLSGQSKIWQILHHSQMNGVSKTKCYLSRHSRWELHFSHRRKLICFHFSFMENHFTASAKCYQTRVQPPWSSITTGKGKLACIKKHTITILLFQLEENKNQNKFNGQASQKADCSSRRWCLWRGQLPRTWQ